jgi:membrane fusion protein (multidrug efflux system)
MAGGNGQPDVANDNPRVGGTAAETPGELRPNEARPIPRAPPPRRKRRWLLPVILLSLVVIAIAITIYYLRFVAPYESTDDAFIEGPVTYVSPRVTGPVVRLLVTDNEQVKQGQLLLEIDPKDYETRLAAAQGDLAAARSKIDEANAQIAVAEANAQQRTAAAAAAEAEARRAEADLKRYESAEARAVSRSQFDLAQTQARSANANLEAARGLEKAAQAQVALSRATAQSATAQLQQAQAAEEQAALNLSYTKVTAPKAGRVTRRTVEQGAFVEIGQTLLAIVPEDVWVIANFKETQLQDMRPGQPVAIEIDSYPGRQFRAHVDSLQAGTGSRFSLLPPENAVGNYVKVVQRVPVKIVFDEPLDPKLDIAPGMSVVPKVRVK